jgi:beta-lactamase class A
MIRMTPCLIAVALVAVTAPPPAVGMQVAAPTDPNLIRLEREIGRLATSIDGRMGVGVVHLESGREVYLHRDDRFPMASSYKVAIAIQLLRRVQRGDFGLDSLVTIAASDLHPGSGMMSSLLDDPGVILSVRNLLELMLLISDNSATDIVLRTAGGARAVNNRLAELGVTGVRVDRSTVRLISDWLGLQVPNVETLGRDSLITLYGQLTDAQQTAANETFRSDPRDTATPVGMASLLAKIWRGEALSPDYTALMLDIMTRSTTGTARLKGRLPDNVEVAHKTGTIGGTTNDVGIITLPENAGHVVTVVFVKDSDRPVEEREAAIAQIARAVYDYFVFNPVPTSGSDAHP